jgi:hypothetical protein
MQTTKSLLTTLLLCVSFSFARAQSDTAIATEKALFFADSLVKANFYQNWQIYTALSCQSAINFYGGKEGFKEHLVLMYYRNEPLQEEKREMLRMVHLMNDVDQWQCVIEKIRSTWINEKKAKVYTYLVGQSVDNGQTWKFVDVSHNSMENLSHVMPGIFREMPVPLGKREFDDEVALQQEAAAQAASTTTKKTTTKKKSK